MRRRDLCPFCLNQCQVASSGLFTAHSSKVGAGGRRIPCDYGGGVSSLPDLRCPPTREADVPGLVARRDLIRERAKAVRS